MGDAMTYLEVVYRYRRQPAAQEMRAIDAVREVYGVQRIHFNDNARTVKVLFDASRLNEDVIASLLRRAGLDIEGRLALA
jgi:hypothetical protein